MKASLSISDCSPVLGSFIGATNQDTGFSTTLPNGGSGSREGKGHLVNDCFQKDNVPHAPYLPTLLEGEVLDCTNLKNKPRDTDKRKARSSFRINICYL